MKAKETITQDQLWATHDLYRDELGQVGDLYAAAKAAGDRKRADRLLDYSAHLRRQFYAFLEEHADILPLDLQTAVHLLQQRRAAAAAAETAKV